MDEQKKSKRNKILNIVVNVVVAVILVVALLVTINNLSSKRQGYTSFFGTAYMEVGSSSMDPNGEWAKAHPLDEELAVGPAGFSKGDLVSVKILKTDAEKASLKKGDVISFFIDATIDGKITRVINSHRIVNVAYNEQTGEATYWTKGDNNQSQDARTVSSKASADGRYCVIGVVKGEAGAFGQMLGFFNSQTGFLVCIVIPSFLIVAYFAFNLIREIVKVKKAGAIDKKAQYEEELIAKLRAQGVQIPADLNAAPEEHSGAEPPTKGEDNK